MTYEVVLSKQADDDLRGIYEYIAFELLAPGNASGQLDRLEAQIYRLAEMPYRHPAYKKEPWRSRGLRFVSVDNYMVFFIPNDNTAVVTVIRVMYGARDVEKQLNEFPGLDMFTDDFLANGIDDLPVQERDEL